eukprot:5134506-Amphidinium_carterae.1
MALTVTLLHHPLPDSVGDDLQLLSPGAASSSRQLVAVRGRHRPIRNDTRAGAAQRLNELVLLTKENTHMSQNGTEHLHSLRADMGLQGSCDGHLEVSLKVEAVEDLWWSDGLFIT